jgi:chromosome segregation ATPase
MHGWDILRRACPSLNREANQFGEIAMRSLSPDDVSAKKSFRQRLTFALSLALLLPIAAAAQQPAVGRQKSPRLTTDDLARPPAERPLADSKEAAASSGRAADGDAAQPKAGEAQVSAEESSWRDQVNKARDRAKETQRTAEEAELRITTLRNDLGKSGQSTQYRNEVVAEMDRVGKQLPELRAQAHAAAEDLASLVEYGRQKGFTESAEPKAAPEGGKPNEEFFRGRLSKLTEEMETARRQIELYENRVRDASQRILMNGGKKGGDNFYVFQLQKDRDDAQQKLEEARTALTKAQTDLDALKEEARRAGVSPDLFR